MPRSKLFLLVLVAAGAILGSLAVRHFSAGQSGRALSESNKILHAEYVQWKKTYGKLYSTPSENDWRFKMFVDSVQLIAAANHKYNERAKATGQVLSKPMFELNHFADLSEEEFLSRYTGLDLSKHEAAMIETEMLQASTGASLKSQGEGYNNPRNLQVAEFEIRTRNQLSCGSCWAFSTISYAEKEYYNNNGIQVDMSQQELIDCDQGSDGCQGGFPHEGLNYIKKKGISKASDYPYTASVGVCSPSKDKFKFGTSFVPQTIQFTLEVATAIASRGVWMTAYVSGYGEFRYVSDSDDVFDTAHVGEECMRNSNHAVTIVDAKDGWVKILNSWGEFWGQRGVKKVKPCSASVIIGTPCSLSHTRLA